MEKYSYSKVESYRKCPFKYLLKYVEGKYLTYNTVATEFGTLVHRVEEHIGNVLKDGGEPDYGECLRMFLEGDGEVLGANALRRKYADEWDVRNKDGMSYADKADAYASSGMYRLERYVRERGLSVYATELRVRLDYKGRLFEGSIDRVLRDPVTGGYIIEDVKTYTKRLAPKELREALQMYVYGKALRESLPEAERDALISYAYDLPLIDARQVAELDGAAIERNLDESFLGISIRDFHPEPTPLCHWCEYCNTNPHQPEAGRNLCPYYMRWTQDDKTRSVENRWMGPARHKAVMEGWLRRLAGPGADGGREDAPRGDGRVRLRIRPDR